MARRDADALRIRLRRRRARAAGPGGTGSWVSVLRRMQRAQVGPRWHPRSWRGAYVPAPPAGAQRVVVKGSILRLGSTGHISLKGALHMQLDYLVKEGAGLDHARGLLYGRDGPEQAGDVLDRSTHDSHHFQFVVSPERGADLDLQAFTKDLMRQVERDLDTGLDWCAVNHYDTDHPHTHIIVRGTDLDGHQLYIRNDYLSQGIRWQAEHLATRELGLRLDLGQEHTQEHERTLDHAPSHEQTLTREPGRGLARDDGWDVDF